MNHDLLATLTLILFLGSLAFVVGGEAIISRISTVVVLRILKRNLGTLQIEADLQGLTLHQLCNQRVEEVVSNISQPLQRFSMRLFGDVTAIVHFHDRSIRHVAKELRTYAFLVILL